MTLEAREPSVEPEGEAASPARQRRPERRRRARPIIRVLESRRRSVWILGLGLFVAPQLLGGATGGAVALTAVMMLGALVISGIATQRRVGAFPVPHLGGLMLLGWVWTAVQALPLPASLTAAIAPEAAELTRGAADTLGLPAPAFSPLTFDPGRTWEELLKGTAIVSSFFSAWLLAASGMRRGVVAAVVVAVTGVGLVGAIHELVGAEALFGVYRPYRADPDVLAPLLNSNHFGGFMAFGAPVALGLGLRHSARSFDRIWLVVAAGLSAGALLSLSRGAAGALFGGCGLFTALFLWRAQGRRRLASAGVVWAVCLLSLALAGAAYAVADRFFVELEAANLDKLELIWAGLGQIERSPWLGVGRGAFSAAFASQVDGSQRFEFVECLPVQWALDWGVPVSLILLFGFGRGVLGRLRGAPSTVRIGSIAGILALASQNLVDFSLEMVGVSVAAAALLGAVVAPTSPRRSEERRLPVRRLVLAVSVGGALLVALLGHAAVTVEPHGVEQQLVKHYQDGSRDSFEALLVSAVQAHPAEPTFALLAGAEAAQHDDPDTGRWLNRAMTLAPGWASPHVVAARWLWRMGRRDQALLELREATQRSPQAAFPFLCQVMAVDPSEDTLLRAAPPSGEPKRATLERATRCPDLDRELLAVIDEVLLSENPDAVAPRLRAMGRRLREGDPSAALALSEEILALEPLHGDAVRLRVDALVAEGRAVAALAELDRLTADGLDREVSARSRAKAAAAAGRDDVFEAASEELRSITAHPSRRLAQSLLFLGELEESRGELAAAIRLYEEANDLDRTTPALRRVLRLSEELGNPLGAFRARQRLCVRAGGEGPHCVALEEAPRGEDPATLERLRALEQPSGGP